MRNYQDLRVWQESHKLTLAVYNATRAFPREELYGLTSQIRRASSSIGANLAEACGRSSTADFSRFVQMAIGSASELDYHHLLAADLTILDAARARELRSQLQRVRKMLSALQKNARGNLPVAGPHENHAPLANSQ